MMKKSSLVILTTVALGVSLPAFAQGDESPKYVCEAGVTIPKHLQSYLGDVSTSRDAAAESAMERCRAESAVSQYCRLLNCYIDDSFVSR